MLLDPTILFFVLGLVAGLLRSNLDIPAATSRFLSLYLLMALGLKGGFALGEAGMTLNVGLALAVSVFMAFIVPVLGYFVLKRLTSSFDAAAIAAAYGSVSAVTFITAVQVAETQGFAGAGHMAVALVLMETPAIIVALMLGNRIRQQQGAQSSPGHAGSPMKLPHLLRESLTDGSQMVLLGALTIGLITGRHGQSMMEPFTGGIFKGMLALFLLDMGINVARQLRSKVKISPKLLIYAVVAPVVHASLALGLCMLLGLPRTDTFLVMVLSASASYIVVPAVLRDAMPEANSALYLGISLAVTFPFNVLVGIPIYLQIVYWVT